MSAFRFEYRNREADSDSDTDIYFAAYLWLFSFEPLAAYNLY